MPRRWCLMLVALAAMALAGDGARPAAQTPAAANQRVWTAVWKYEQQFPDPRRRYSIHIKSGMEFNGVEEISAEGTRRWLSRDWAWSYLGIHQEFGVIMYDPAIGRYKVNRTKTCTGGGPVNLGPTDSSQANEGAPTLHSECETIVTPADDRGPRDTSRTSSTGDVNQFPTVGPPQDGCSVSEAGRHVQGTNVTTTSYSLTVSPYVDAVLEVDRDGEYGKFVPVPSKTLTVTAHVRSHPEALFRFELDSDGTSHFPGYATNANIDDVFFVKHNLTHLHGVYANDGPDVIFDRERFGRLEWSRIEPSVVETRSPQAGVVVTVTAMDYGAVGKLRGFVKAEGCGDWQPIKILVDGQPRDALAIPLDDDDNLMADVLEMYRGMDSGADADAEPKGNSTAGDGLTAFEEYRGVVISGGDCGDSSTDTHIRTKPDRKDLFVHTPIAKYESALAPFAQASGLNVHSLCERHYSRSPTFTADLLSTDGDLGTRSQDRSRVVNFTLQFASAHAWQGRQLSQQVPQHALYLTSGCVKGTRAVACSDDPPTCADRTIGPPMLTSAVFVCPRTDDDPSYVPVGVIVHELGHGVGMPHHGAVVQKWEMVQVRNEIAPEPAGSPIPGQGGPRHIGLEPGLDCQEPRPGGDTVGLYNQGKFVGCLTIFIVARNGDHSGNAECPMRYGGGAWYYEAPEAEARRSAVVWFDEARDGQDTNPVTNRDGSRGSARVQLYAGRFGVYDNALDPPFGVDPFCSLKDGTGLNALPGHRNHAGDSQVACMDQLVINDNALRGIR